MTEFSRIVLKRSITPGVSPTVPEIDNLNQFLGTDIFEGELFYNVPDKKLYIRSGEEIVLLSTPSDTYTKVYEIGPWNMSTGTIEVGIFPEMDVNSVVGISVSVRNDDGDVFWTNHSRLEVLEFDAGNVRLKSSGALLSETSTSFNRGWVKIEFKK
jgi:hypothetical protein